MNLHKLFADNLLSNLYDVDTSIEIHPEHLWAGNKEEIFQNFIHYRNAIEGMFDNISKTVENTQISDMDFNESTPEGRDARDSAVIPMRCIFAVLWIIGNHGLMENDRIKMNKKIFKDYFKKVKKEYVKNAVNTLADNGFIFEHDVFDNGIEFEVSYPDDSAVLLGLVSFSSTIGNMSFGSACYDYTKAAKSFILMNTHLYQWQKDEEKPYELYDILRFINKSVDKKAAELLHKKMIAQGFSFQYSISTFLDQNVSIRYQIGKYDPYAMLCVKSDGKAYVGLKMRTLQTHTEYIQKCSAIFKEGFNNAWKDCVKSECLYGITDTANCECRVVYTNKNQAYDKCTNTGWEYTWDRTVFPLNEEDFDSYFYFINQKHKKSVRNKNPDLKLESSDKISPYDREKFTLDVIRPHFKKNIGVMAVCGTSKGFIDVSSRSFIHEALFRSKIHPKTKAIKLTDKEIENLYNIMIEMVNETQNSGKFKESINAKVVGKPCPICATPIQKGEAFTSTFYICPNCQKEK